MGFRVQGVTGFVSGTLDGRCEKVAVSKDPSHPYVSNLPEQLPKPGTLKHA